MSNWCSLMTGIYQNNIDSFTVWAWCRWVSAMDKFRWWSASTRSPTRWSGTAQWSGWREGQTSRWQAVKTVYTYIQSRDGILKIKPIKCSYSRAGTFVWSVNNVITWSPTLFISTYLPVTYLMLHFILICINVLNILQPLWARYLLYIFVNIHVLLFLVW